jgi:SAM-dependent methyltransferase
MNWIKDQNGIFVQDHQEVISYPESGNDDCFELEDESLWFKQRNELILTLIKKHVINGNFLDIGGGNGFQAKALLDAKYVGSIIICEPGYKGCLNAKKRGIQNVFNGLFQDFPFQEQKIKAVGLFDVIEHIEDDIKFLNELYDKLDENSYVLINVPAMKILWSDVDILAGHFRRYNLKDIQRISSLTKFKVIDNSYFFSQYFLPLFLLRVLPFKLGLISNKSTSENEKKNHKRTNLFSGFLNYLHNKNLNNVMNSRRIKFGTSIFMVLKK